MDVFEAREGLIRLCSLLGLLLAPGAALADYNQHLVYSVEWLACESDTIALVRNEGERRTVLHTLKGSGEIPDELFELSAFRFGYDIDQPWSSKLNPWRKGEPAGRISLLFLRKGKILQDVVFGRVIPGSHPSVKDRFYGVTETGDLITSEPELIHAVNSALKEKRGDPIVRLRRAPFKEYSGATAPRWFALESTGDTYVIITKFDEAWRDRMIAMAQEGTAAERIWALVQLSWNDDKKSVDVLKRTAARLPEDVIPSGGGRDKGPLGAADVQRAAQARLNWLRSR